MDIRIILSILGLLISVSIPIIAYTIRRRSISKNYFSVIWKSSKKLKPKDLLGERPYNSYYFHRSSDNIIARAIERSRNLLIAGPPLSGKTRAVYNALKSQKKSYKLLVPKNVNFTSLQFPKIIIPWKHRLIFIDDLQYFTERNENFHLFFSEAKKREIPIIAAVHSGTSLKMIKNKMIERNIDIETIFNNDILELEKISADEAKEVCKKCGIDWNNVKFNGTIGSIFMKLAEMERRFDSLGDAEKTVLRTLKILHKTGICEQNSYFEISWIKTAAAIFELEAKEFQWFSWLKTLEEKEFIKITSRKIIWAEEVYLAYLINFDTEFDQIDLFKSVINLFENDARVLNLIGEKSFHDGSLSSRVSEYMDIVIQANEKILSINTESTKNEKTASALLMLGQAYRLKSKVQDTLANCKKAIDYFNKSIETISGNENTFLFAEINDKLGNAYSRLAEIENRKNNCQTAIQAYAKAAKYFTKEKFPVKYASLNNNLSGAYLILADSEGDKEYYKKAIEASKNALEINLKALNPTIYAYTKNNLANAYTRLADFESTERNLITAINHYEDILGIQTKESHPMHYGITMNNLGNAYSLLAKVKNQNENIKKAIDAYNKALEVRDPEQVPVQYANTKFNIGDLWLQKAEIDSSNAEWLYNALDSFNEALKIKTETQYPEEYAYLNFRLGIAYIMLAKLQDKTGNYYKAIEAFDNSLKIFTEEKYPKLHFQIQGEISKAKKIFFE
jgi:tetratricopeptide (TPR) repeat protein